MYNDVHIIKIDIVLCISYIVSISILCIISSILYKLYRFGSCKGKLSPPKSSLFKRHSTSTLGFCSWHFISGSQRPSIDGPLRVWRWPQNWIIYETRQRFPFLLRFFWQLSIKIRDSEQNDLKNNNQFRVCFGCFSGFSLIGSISRHGFQHRNGCEKATPRMPPGSLDS